MSTKGFSVSHQIPHPLDILENKNIFMYPNVYNVSLSSGPSQFFNAAQLKVYTTLKSWGGPGDEAIQMYYIMLMWLLTLIMSQ